MQQHLGRRFRRGSPEGLHALQRLPAADTLRSRIVLHFVDFLQSFEISRSELRTFIYRRRSAIHEPNRKIAPGSMEHHPINPIRFQDRHGRFFR